MNKATKYIAVMTAVLFILFPIQVSATEEENENSYRITYYVEAGDTLSRISQHYGVDFELLAAMNNLDTDARVLQGQRIYVPREPEINYSLEAGDTLWNVAQKYGVHVDDLVSYNQITDPGRLKIGQVIKIPVQSAEEMTPVRVAAKPALNVASRGLSGLSLPVMGIISSGYGWRKSGFHHGTDIAAKTGTPIRAVEAGNVIFSGWRAIYGYSITIDHGNEIQSVYGHASKLLVKKGQQVNKGQIIARVGDTGRTTGPHLHLEIHVNGKTVDPMRYLPKL
ncbi:peptidoglycan DD-metalloendopeptidase family protein [Candidatus Formimonas warabiya]|uniref:LysM domain-containing protein n=1 Tax=Formimonas warabiya TaxID=1761012 RepID=A0A3G1KUX2_FORW1|nr:M23 family metallopeptidase [Candidatus Formimonas warabiya]ATW25995.1 hypothetical protein DCMF_15520 [Candidatus Formimonas warabiya]